MDLQGKTLVFTGALRMKRGEAIAMATAAGAIVTGSVSGKTNIVVAGPDGILLTQSCRVLFASLGHSNQSCVDSRFSAPFLAINTKKVLDAQAQGTEIWDEGAFIKSCNEGPGNAPSAPAASALPRKKGKAAAAMVTPPTSDDDDNDETDDNGGVGWLYECRKAQWAPFGPEVILFMSFLALSDLCRPLSMHSNVIKAVVAIEAAYAAKACELVLQAQYGGQINTLNPHRTFTKLLR